MARVTDATVRKAASPPIRPPIPFLVLGAWGWLAAGIFGMQALGGLGGVSFMSQLIGTLLGVGTPLIGGFVVYGMIKKLVGIHLDQEEEFNGADLSIHMISATAEREPGW